MCRANIVAAGFQCAAVGIVSSGTVHNAVRVATFCQSVATAEMDQRTTPISPCGHQFGRFRGRPLTELRKIPVPECLTEQTRLQRSAPSKLQHLVSQRRQLEPNQFTLETISAHKTASQNLEPTLRQVVVRWSKEGRIKRTGRGMYQKT